MPYGGNNLPPSLAPIARSQNQGYQIRGAASQGSNAVLRTAISNAAGHAPNNNTPMPPQSCSRVASATGASGVGQMNINTSQAAAAHAANTQAILQAPVWNPSMGPSPSIMPSGQKIPTNPATNMSNMSQAQPITANQICKTFPRDAKYFKLGEIISIPFHEPNSNPNLQPQDHRLRLTWKGSVFTKRRMMVVLWIYKRDMFCLPLYSFNGAGLNSKSRFIQPEYVCLKELRCDEVRQAGRLRSN